MIRGLNNYDFVLINRGHKKSKNIGKESSAYQIIRTLIGYVVNLIIRISFSIESMDSFLQSVKDLPRMSKELNKAKSNVGTKLDDLLGNLRISLSIANELEKSLIE